VKGFNSFLELNYLHPNRNKPDTGIYNLLGITNGQPYVVLRLVAWGGHHDFGHSGLSTAVQEQIVSLLSKDYKVFISSETALPEFFEPYRIRLPSYKIHDLLAFATLFIGESGTMAGESVILGTPVIYVNSLPLMGYLQEAQRNGLLFHFSDDQQVALKVEELLAMKDVKETFRANHRKHLEGKIDGTSFLVWFLENYPKSAEIMRSDPEYQLEFDPIKY
jgi:predicted glycosyltransferase